MTIKLISKLGLLAGVIATSACTGMIGGESGDDMSPGGVTPPGGGSTGGSSSTGGQGQLPTEAKGKLDLRGTPKYFRVLRITNEQWTNSVQQALALPAAPTNAEAFQDPVSGTTDFTNNELVLSIDARAVSDFESAAEELAKTISSDPAALSRIYSGTDGTGFIAALGRRLYRRPLTTSEADAYKQLFDVGSAMTGDKSPFAKGAAVVIEAMLQSPHFLYRTELGQANTPLSPYELAAKLSLWLRDAGPDDALLDAAGSGKLDTAEGISSVVKELLDAPTAKKVLARFHSQFLHFDRFNNLSKVGVDNYDTDINEELAESSRLFFDRIFSQGLGVKDIFLSTKGFVGPRLAPLYQGINGAAASGMSEVDLGAGRLGYFTQIPFLMLNAHNGEPDPIHRGVTISLDVLCAPLGPPAAEIPPLPKRMPGQTNRMVVDEHTKGCGTVCHNNMINPLGFAFENFDGMGQYRTVERYGTEELPVDASGQFNFVGGTKSYTDAFALMEILAEDPQTHLCYSKKLASYALQRDVVEADGGLLTDLSKISAEGSVKRVIETLVTSNSFRMRAGGTQ